MTEPSLIPVVVVAAATLALSVAVLVVLALERGDPAEVAVAYELAWDRLDFDLLWRLSAPELRDGRDRAAYTAAKREAYGEGAERGLVRRAGVERLDRVGRRARAVTRLELGDGSVVRDELRLRRHQGRWAVESYRMGDGEGSRPAGRGDASGGGGPEGDGGAGHRPPVRNGTP